MTDVAGRLEPMVLTPPVDRTRWTIILTCGDCSGELDPRAGGPGTAADKRQTFTCSECGHEWLLAVQLIRLTNPARRQQPRPT